MAVIGSFKIGHTEYVVVPRAEYLRMGGIHDYSKSGSVVSRSDKRTGTERFEHDPLGQLTKVVRDRGLVEILRYDEACNVARGGEPATYGHGDIVEERGNVEYVHDAEARIIEKRTRSGGKTRVTQYTWSDAGLLAAVTTEDTRVEFDYDAFARRLGKQAYGRDHASDRWRLTSRTRFVWNESLLVHEIREEARASGDPVVRERTFLHDDTSRPFAQGERASGDVSTSWLYYVCDSSGFPHHLVDDGGAVVHELAHDSFGRLDPACDADATPLRYLGQYEDRETGLVYNRFRYYDPDLGRYVSPDPQGLARGLNVFRYAENSPNDFADPLGLAPCTSVVTGNLPDGTPVSATGSSASLRGPRGRSADNQADWPPSVWSAIQATKDVPPARAPNWPPGNCAEPDAIANYLRAARQAATDRKLTPVPTDEELLKGIKKIKTSNRNGPEPPCVSLREDPRDPGRSRQVRSPPAEEGKGEVARSLRCTGDAQTRTPTGIRSRPFGAGPTRSRNSSTIR
jgi:RHS repeat-associated protein